MNKSLMLFLLLCMSPLAYSCDESCLRDKAQTKHGIKFPSYLDNNYCRNTSVDFLVSARKSLQQYRDERLPEAHRGGIRNIRNFLEQRKEWLQECDNYLNLTDQGRVFRNKETGDKIFASITSLSDELQRLVGTPRTTNEDPNTLTELAREKFELMFKQIDSHRTDLQLRGVL